MIKCYFVDVKSISSDLPRSNFIEAELEKLADLILETDGLLRPLILQESGREKYTVLEGHREYYAAVRAKEKDLKKAEMVNAFIIDTKIEKSAIEQLNLLNEHEHEPLISRSVIEPIPSIFEQLLPAILSTISQQLQPILEQLAEHKQILDTIKLAEIIKPSIEGEEKSKSEASPPSPPAAIVEPIKVVKVTPDRKKKSKSEGNLPSPPAVIVDFPEQPKIQKIELETKIKSTPKSKKKSQAVGILPLPIPEVIESPKPPDLTVVKSARITKPVETKTGSDILESIDSTKSTNALNLINTLSQDLLTLSMERSGLSKLIVKSVPNLIKERNDRPEQKFDSWETIVTAKITGLRAAAIKQIIDKLK